MSNLHSAWNCPEVSKGSINSKGYCYYESFCQGRVWGLLMRMKREGRKVICMCLIHKAGLFYQAFNCGLPGRKEDRPSGHMNWFR